METYHLSNHHHRTHKLLLGAAVFSALAGSWLVRTGRYSVPSANHAELRRSSRSTLPSPAVSTSPRVNPVQGALPTGQTAYEAGQYAQAEATAQRAVDRFASSADPSLRKQVASARRVLAFSAARRHDLPLARQRFALLQEQAARLPDHGKQEAKPGENPPTLEEEGAYQHAVLTGAMGDEKGAEVEYRRFMARYPESPLVQSAIMRVARLHGGNIPADAQAAWQGAMKTAQEREKARQREASLCGPECVVELLRRRKGRGDGSVSRGEVEGLAQEMRLDERGTSLTSLAGALQKRGFRPRGLSLTWSGLLGQKLPVVALVRPGHYVLVDAASPAGVTAWDPDARGIGRGAPRVYSVKEWRRLWGGITLAL